MGVTRWRGPDVLVVGWIPFSMGAPAGWGSGSGFTGRLLFQSGNPQPPPSFGGQDGFSGWRYGVANPFGSKEFRAALYLGGVVAEFPEGAPPRMDREANGAFLGYTPLRVYAAGINLAAILPQVTQYTKGTGPRLSPVLHVDQDTGSWAEFRYRAEFKLSPLPNVAGRALTGAWAPYAWCEIAYRLHRRGEVEVRVDGSAIPSQRLYIDWSTPRADPTTGVVPEHDMRDATPEDVAGFLRTTGWGCKPAPRASLLTWRGMAAPC
ncbi:MAG TPA: hypothetical protein VFS20_12850 [Longimicrobium sp.]|nr:hypothetical protein [Longimicrobium sp.]